MKKTDNTSQKDILRQLFAEEEYNTNPICKDTIDNWYLARAYADKILHGKLLRMNDDNELSAPLHISVEGVSPKMQAVIREIVLRAHYIDFDENEKTEELSKRSVITILYNGKEEDARQTLLNAPFLGNLFHYTWIEPLPYLDIEFRLVERNDNMQADVSETDLHDFSQKNDIPHYIDISMAKLVNMTYHIGDDLIRLPNVNPDNIDLYTIALAVFRNGFNDAEIDKEWDKLSVKDKMSNICCTDTFYPRLLRLSKNRIEDTTGLKKAIKKNIHALAKSEHSRWLTEKLIFNFKPWTKQNYYEYSQLFGDAKNKYRKKLKSKYSHIDICSYRDLTRIDPGNRKFDVFIMLAMPYTYQKCKQHI